MDAHCNEYAGAVTGMALHYGRPAQSRGARWVAGRLVPTYAVGDWVTFRDQHDVAHSGRVVEVDDLGLALVHVSDGRYVATSTDQFFAF